MVTFTEVIAKRIAHAVLSLFWTTLLVSVIYKHVHKYENYCSLILSEQHPLVHFTF